MASHLRNGPIDVVVDLVVFTLVDRRLAVMLLGEAARPKDPFQLWAPSVGYGDDLDELAKRTLLELSLRTSVRQFHTFGAVDRVPNKRVIAVGYMAVAPLDALRSQVTSNRRLYALRDDRPVTDDGMPVELLYDHGDIIAAAVADLRANLDVTDFAFGLLPEAFTLRQLQEVHEAIRGRPANKPAFRKRMLDSGKVAPTGRREEDQRFRPAELYRLRPADERQR